MATILCSRGTPCPKVRRSVQPERRQDDYDQGHTHGVRAQQRRHQQCENDRRHTDAQRGWPDISMVAGQQACRRRTVPQVRQRNAAVAAERRQGQQCPPPTGQPPDAPPQRIHQQRQQRQRLPVQIAGPAQDTGSQQPGSKGPETRRAPDGLIHPYLHVDDTCSDGFTIRGHSRFDQAAQPLSPRDACGFGEVGRGCRNIGH